MTAGETSVPIRVLLVDDHGVVRRGLRGYLELLDDIEVVGEADDGLCGVELAASSASSGCRAGPKRRSTRSSAGSSAIDGRLTSSRR